jgi:hypothetical protein
VKITWLSKNLLPVKTKSHVAIVSFGMTQIGITVKVDVAVIRPKYLLWLMGLTRLYIQSLNTMIGVASGKKRNSTLTIE